MRDILVVGSYNVGLSVFLPRMPAPGETLLGSRFDMGPGGKGSNQAITIARLGGCVRMITKVGSDVFGLEAVDLFEREGIDTTYVYTDPETHTGAGVIFVNEAGQNSIGVAPGANSRLTEDDLGKASELFRSCAVLLVQLEIPLGIVESAIHRAKSSGAAVILNPAPACQLQGSVLQMVDILTPNETEASVLTGRSVETREDAVSAAHDLIAAGVKSVIITMGGSGCVLVRDGEVRSFPAFPVEAVDTTGAGDAFNGGLAYGLSTGMDIEDAIVFASKVAAISVTSVGVVPGLPTMQAVVDRFGKE